MARVDDCYRITYLITNAFGSGGTIRTKFTMAAALAERGHDVEVVSLRRHRPRPRLELDPRVRLRVLVDDSPRVQNRRRARRGPIGGLKRLAHRVLSRAASWLAHPADVRYRSFSLRTDLALWRFARSLEAGQVVIGTRPALNLFLARHAPRATRHAGPSSWGRST